MRITHMTARRLAPSAFLLAHDTQHTADITG
jgi:hypothetical protein